MSRRLPALNGREVIRALEKTGFVVVRIKGSHHFLVHRNDYSAAIWMRTARQSG